MTRLGCDTAQLRELAEAFSNAAGQMDSSSTGVDRAVRATRWQGRDSDRFALLWARHRSALGSVRADLAEAAGELRRNVAEQERASGSSSPPAAAAAVSATTRNDARPIAQMTAKPAPAGPPPFGDPLPRRTEVWELSGSLAAAVGLSGTGRVTVADLRGELSTVTVESTTDGSLEGGASIDMGLDHGPGVALGADATILAGTRSRRTWQVGDAELPGFLARLAANETWDNLWGLPTPNRSPMNWSPLEQLTDAVGSLVLPDLGDPSVVDDLVRVGAGASLAASFGVPVASLGGALENSVGIRNRSGTASLLLETSAEYRSEAVGHRSATAGVWTIEVPLVGGDNQPVVATEMLSDGSGQTLRRSVVGFDRSEVAELVDSARRHIGDGEAEAAAADLQALWSTADSGVTWRDATFGEIDSDLHELDVGAALGPKLGGSVGAGRLVVEYGD